MKTSLFLLFSLPLCAGITEIENESHRISFDSKTAILSLSHQGAEKNFAQVTFGKTDIKTVTPSADGTSLKLWATTDGMELSLVHGSQFIHFTRSIYNSSPNTLHFDQIGIPPLKLNVEGIPASRLKAFGTKSFSRVSKNKGSDTFQAIVNPTTRVGVVSGWLSHERGLGTFSTEVKRGKVILKPLCYYGRFATPSGETLTSETLLIGSFDDARLGLEAYANEVALHEKITLPPLDSTHFLETEVGEIPQHDEDMTDIEAYRKSLDLIRESAGDQTFLLGEFSHQTETSLGASFGKFKAMQVGLKNGSRTYFLHNRVWQHQLAPTNRLETSWASFMGKISARPVDLFDSDLPRIWHLEKGDRHLVGLFNWSEADITISDSFERIGMSGTEFIGFDFWNNKFLGTIDGVLALPVPKQDCRIIALRKPQPYPQVISTSRDVNQGISEITEEKWNPETKTLTIIADLTAGEAYELRLISLHPLKTATATGITVTPQQEEHQLRVSLTPQKGGKTEITLTF